MLSLADIWEASLERLLENLLPGMKGLESERMLDIYELRVLVLLSRRPTPYMFPGTNSLRPEKSKPIL